MYVQYAARQGRKRANMGHQAKLDHLHVHIYVETLEQVLYKPKGCI